MLPINSSMSVFVDRGMSRVEEDFFGLVDELIVEEGLARSVAIARATELFVELDSYARGWDKFALEYHLSSFE